MIIVGSMPLLLSLEECVSYRLQVIHTIEVRPWLGRWLGVQILLAPPPLLIGKRLHLAMLE
jgi:hypothetical protein